MCALCSLCTILEELLFGFVVQLTDLFYERLQTCGSLISILFALVLFLLTYYFFLFLNDDVLENCLNPNLHFRL